MSKTVYLKKIKVGGITGTEVKKRIGEDKDLVIVAKYLSPPKETAKQFRKQGFKIRYL